MNTERVFSYLIGLEWLFLIGWIVLLAAAGAAVFAQDLLRQGSSSEPPHPRESSIDLGLSCTRTARN